MTEEVGLSHLFDKCWCFYFGDLLILGDGQWFGYWDGHQVRDLF
jgi:hypothetical protein